MNSFKEFNFHKTARFRVLIIFVIVLSLLTIWPDLVVYGFFVAYTILSYILSIQRLIKAKKLKANHQFYATTGNNKADLDLFNL